MTAGGATWIEKARILLALADPGVREPADPECVATLPTHDRFCEIARGRAGDPVPALAELLRKLSDRELFYLFAYHPTTVLDEVVPQIRVHATWSVTTNLYDAWWRLAAAGELTGVEPRGQRTAALYFARHRWLLYSLPFRHGADSGIDADDRSSLGPATRLVTRAREAREDWLAVLDTIDDHSLLARDIDVEGEVGHLLRSPVNRARLGRADNRADDRADRKNTDPVDVTVWRHCVRRHLLPRFAVGEVWGLARRLAGRAGRAYTHVATGAFCAALLLLVLGVGRWWPAASGWLTAAATGAAAVGYGAVLVAGARERAATWPWLMRQPASAMLGAVTLVALHPAWWRSGGALVKVGAVAALSAVAIGYLTIEAANHGVPAGWKLLRRVAGVSALGWLHAVMVSAVALRWFVPALSEKGGRMAALWSPAELPVGTPAAWSVFALAAAWCFAAGVFSQILWDEQPFTAPLAHLGWRKER